MKKLLFVLIIFLGSCTANQKITYKTNDISAHTTKSIPIALEVRILNDNRPNMAENAILFTNPHQTKINGQVMCINAEKHYKDSVATQITKILVDHFNKVNLFEMAHYKENSNSNYYLTGTLNNFYGEQKYSSSAAVGAQFGLIGALATAGIKTPGKIIIEISDLKLYKKDGTLMKDLGSFYKEYKDDFSADGYCWCIYWNMNEKLKEFNTQLVEKIRADLSDVEL